MKCVRIEQAFEFIRNGKSIKQSGKDGYPITRIETISNGIVDIKKLGYASIHDISRYNDYILLKNDILMSHINSEKHLGKTAIFKIDTTIIHGMNLLCLRPNINFIDGKYAYYFFNSYYFKNQIPRITKKSVNQASFTVTALKQLQIPLPPLLVQKKIVDLLDKAQSLIDKRKEQITLCDELVQSVFYDMFGDPVKNEKGWEVGTIRDLCCEVKYGTSKKAHESQGDYEILRMNNITYKGYWNFNSLKYIDLEEREKDKYLVRKNDLLFNRTNSKELVGKTAVYSYEKPRAIAGYLIRVRVNDFANPYYIWGYLNSYHGKLKLLNMCKSIVGMANINAQELQNIKISKPPTILQNQFADKVQRIEAQKELMQRSLDEMEDNFKGLMQRAFRGEIG